MAPPLETVSIEMSISQEVSDSHGNHLHVSSLQTAVELILVASDNSLVVRIDAELATPHMVAKGAAVWRRLIYSGILLVESRHLGLEMTWR